MRARTRTWREIAGQQRRVDDDEERQWPIWSMVIGLFAMIVAFWWVASSVLITYWLVGRLFCAFAFAGNLFYGEWTRRVFAMARPFWFMFNLLAIGPALFCAFFTLNALITSDTRSFIVPEPVSGLGIKAYWIEHEALPPVLLRSPGTSIGVSPDDDPEERKYSVMRVSLGFLGFDVLGWREPDRVLNKE